MDDAGILNMLDDLGDPEEVVAAAAPPSSSRRARLHEIAAVLFLLGGAFVVPGVGWLAAVVAVGIHLLRAANRSRSQ